MMNLKAAGPVSNPDGHGANKKILAFEKWFPHFIWQHLFSDARHLFFLALKFELPRIKVEAMVRYIHVLLLAFVCL
jgi:hypothetical protein